MKVLKGEIPTELLEKCIKTTGLTSLTDTSLFTKSSIRLKEFEELLPELEKYYQPYRARQHLIKPMTARKAVSNLKLLLKSQQIHLASSVKGVAGVRMMWYSVTHPVKITTDILVTFL